MIFSGEIKEMRKVEYEEIKIETNGKLLTLNIPSEVLKKNSNIINNNMLSFSGEPYFIKNNVLFFNKINTDILKPAAANIDGEKYVKIAELSNYEYKNIFGVLIDWLDCTESRGSDYMTTLFVVDESTEKKLLVKIFSKDKILQKGLSAGNIIKIPGIKLYEENKAIMGRKFMPTVVYDIKENTQYSDERITELINFYKSTRNSSTNLVESFVPPNNFFDYYGELLEIKKEKENLVIIKMTDYKVLEPLSSVERHDLLSDDMILIIKAWGIYAEKAMECEVGEFYLIKNLRNDENNKNFTPTAILSEYKAGGIIKLASEDFRYKTLKDNKSEFNKNCEKGNDLIPIVIETPERFKKFKISKLKDINEKGLYRVKVRVKQHAPFKGFKFLRCNNCNLTKKDMKKNICECEEQSIEKIKVLRLLISDNTDEINVVCKNKLVDEILDESNIQFLTGAYFDCLIIQAQSQDNIVYHMIDATFIKN